MKSFLSNEKGIAGGYIVIAAILILGAFVMVEYASMFNQLLETDDTLAADQMITEKGHNYIEDYVTALKFIPIIIMFALLAWGLVYAHEHRST